MFFFFSVVGRLLSGALATASRATLPPWIQNKIAQRAYEMGGQTKWKIQEYKNIAIFEF
jgi:hypothetical protein